MSFLSWTPEYRAWQNALNRCYDPENEKYPHYGGRGILVCDPWLLSVDTFLRDMGPRPEGYTLDRINTDGNYEPNNCRWTSQEEQQNNRTNNVRITWGEETRTISQWARELGFDYAMLYRRIVLKGETFPVAARPRYERKAA